MKKAGILTIHSAYNYGAVLQAYATQQTFKNLGVDCDIIDYNVSFVEKDKKFLLLPTSTRNIKNNIRNILQPKNFFARKKFFKKFIDDNLSLSSKKFTADNIKDVCYDGYDCLVTGSDQTFNVNLNNCRKDLYSYFLPFEFKGKKYSYASSMGEKMHLITEEQSLWIKENLSDFDALSVREPVAAEFIEDLLGVRPEVIYDPTLVLSKNEWNNICDEQNIPNEKYILFYTVLSSSWVVEYVKEISRITGLKVIAAHPQNSFESRSGFKRMSNIGPAQFIGLIKNAELVLTSSFHGTVFSMIYGKAFYSFVLGEGNRINNLLSSSNLTYRAIKKEERPKEIVFHNEDVNRLDDFFDNIRRTNLSFIERFVI